MAYTIRNIETLKAVFVSDNLWDIIEWIEDNYEDTSYELVDDNGDLVELGPPAY